MGPGKKFDSDKLRVDLLPVGALLEVAEVLLHGAKKYGANNWQNVRPVSRYYGATLRHLWARARGETHDPESGLPHLAHAACCVLFMLSIEVGTDNPNAFEPDEDRYCPECEHDMCMCPVPDPAEEKRCPPDCEVCAANEAALKEGLSGAV